VAFAQHLVFSMACDNNLSLFKTVDATGNSFVKTKLALWRLKVLTVQKGKKSENIRSNDAFNAQCNTQELSYVISSILARSIPSPGVNLMTLFSRQSILSRKFSVIVDSFLSSTL